MLYALMLLNAHLVLCSFNHALQVLPTLCKDRDRGNRALVPWD
jgi:hypothetical protein